MIVRAYAVGLPSLQPRPAQRDLDEGFLDEVLGTMEVTGEQVRRAQQPTLGSLPTR